MSDNKIKDIRKQVRVVCKEILPEALQQAISADFQMALISRLEYRMNQMDEKINATLKAIDERTKDVQHMVLRQSAGLTTKSTK